MVASTPAILFWFYRDAALCENRLRTIRRFNPGCRIFGLYGGDPARAEEFEGRLRPLLDDFYAYDGPGDPWWKWINGDLVIRAWYVERGRQLDWRSVLVVQWDVLILGPVTALVGSPAEDEVVLSGLRPVSEVDAWWPWVSGENGAVFDSFMRRLRERTHFQGQGWCCQFVLVCFGRRFLEEYARVDEPEAGFIEYRVPTYAHAFGLRVSALRASCWWEGDPTMATVPERGRILSARRSPVATRHVLRSWIANRATAAHPYRLPFPLDTVGVMLFLKRNLLQRARSALNPAAR
ncbi:MAG TPA: hypothetical protein VFL93_02435 [Longimicrobiaceae bacterium]|nr:hypothetical protein [Longimicrobiaceae bacterium]